MRSRASEQRAAFRAPVDRGGGAQKLRLPAAGWRRKRNAVVRRFHYAADRLRAIAQRLRAAKDLDLLHRQRIERHAVVLAEVGEVQRSDAVLLDPYAEIVEPAQHRS
jgi:hypothetical protein